MLTMDFCGFWFYSGLIFYFILFKITVNFKCIFIVFLFIDLTKTKTRANKKNMRHSFFNTDLMSMSVNFIN